MQAHALLRLETATRLLRVLGLVATWIGGTALVVGAPWLERSGALVLTSGLVLMAASVATGHPLEIWQSLPPAGARGGSDRRGERMRLRTAALLLQALACGGLVIAALAFLLRSGAIKAGLSPGILERGALILVFALTLTTFLAQRYALRAPGRRDPSGTRVALIVMTLAVVTVVATRAVIASWSGGDVGGVLGGAVSVTVLTGHALTAYALFLSRGLPNATSMFFREEVQGRPRAEAKHAFFPAILAFGLLLLVFLLFVLFGVGVVDVMHNVARSPVVMGALVFLVLAIAGTLGAAVGIARDQERQTVLWQPPRNPRERLQASILFSGLGVGGLLLGLSLLVWRGGALGVQESVWVHLFCLGLLVMLGPYGFYMAREHARIRGLEERFPDLLRDLASSHKGGLTLAESVAMAARGEYGPLTPEVHKMADQLSWNVSFNEALIRFGDRVQTPLVERAVSLIMEANRSGGSTTDVLMAASRDAREIKNLENERRLSMGLYTIVVYITFLVFLGVAAVLYDQFVPAMVGSSQAAAASPLAATDVHAFSAPSLRLEDFQMFYFMAAVVQGLGDGIVAGLMGSGKAVLGLRHAFVMVLLSYLTFTLFLV